MKFRKKPVAIDAWQWIKHGDVSHAPITKIDVDDDWVCAVCGEKASDHANCRTLEGYHIVCPNDWIIKGVKGEFYPCKPDIFEMTYEAIGEKK